MGSITEINDTLQLTREQGFPLALDLEKHLRQPFHINEFEKLVFEFRNKPSVRIFHMPPVRNFLVENKNGKWIYWGLIHILQVTHDYVNKTTSGKFKIIYLNTPEEMKKAHELIDRNKNTSYFSK